MSDDVRSAAERLADRWGCVRGADATEQVVDELLNDGQLVARAHLADHPADDAEPVDESFLRALGFDPADSFTHDLYPVRIELFGDGTGEAIIGGVIFPHMNTRGDVRRLFAGLQLALPLGTH